MKEQHEIFTAIINNDIDKVNEIVLSGIDLSIKDDSEFIGRNGIITPRDASKNPLDTAYFLKRKEIITFLESVGAKMSDEFKKRYNEELVPASKCFKVFEYKKELRESSC